MEAIPSSLVVKGLFVTLIRNVAWKIRNVAEWLQIGFAMLLFQKLGPFFMRRIPKLPLNWSRAEHGTILGRL